MAGTQQTTGPKGFSFQSLSGYFVAHDSMVSDDDNVKSKVRLQTYVIN